MPDPSSLPSTTVSGRPLLPSISAVYYAFDGDDRLLYIGKTTNLLRRWSDHEVIAQGALRVAWVPCEPDRLTELEADEIAAHHPPLNGRRGWRTALAVAVSPELFERIETFRFEHRFDTRSEALRWLTRYALDAHG